MKSHSNKKRRRKRKLSGDELNELRRCVRIGHLRDLLRDRCGPVLPDDDAGREYLKQLLLPISLGPNEAARRSDGVVGIWGPVDRMICATEIWAPWMSEDEALFLRLTINEMPRWERWLSQDELGRELNVTFAERERLQLWGINPCDMPMTGKAMALIKKQKKRKLNKRRYTKSRAEYLAASLSQTKPWEQEGISRRTWERRRVVSQRQVKLTKEKLSLASKVELSGKASSCVRVSTTATPPVQSLTYANGGFLTPEEAAWLVGDLQDLVAGSSRWKAA